MNEWGRLPLGSGADVAVVCSVLLHNAYGCSCTLTVTPLPARALSHRPSRVRTILCVYSQRSRQIRWIVRRQRWVKQGVLRVHRVDRPKRIRVSRGYADVYELQERRSFRNVPLAISAARGSRCDLIKRWWRAKTVRVGTHARTHLKGYNP